MKQFIINHADGTTTDLVSNIECRAVTAAVQNMALLGEDTINLTIKSAKPIAFYIGDTMKANGRTYTVNTLPAVKKTGGRIFEYTLELEGPQYQLINTTWLLSIDSKKDTLTGTLSDFASELLKNVNRLYEGWALNSDIPTTETKTITYTDQNCLQVLQDLCTQFEAEFFIKEEDDGTKTINIKSKVGQAFETAFSYGQGGGVYELTRNKQENTDLITRLYAFGGSKNLPQNYAYDRLLIADTKNASYVQDATAIAAYGVHEGVFTDDDIYPQYEGTITALGDDEKTFTDANFPFDLGAKDESGNTKYLQNNVNAKITFQTGNLAGYEFEIDRDAYKYTEGAGIKFVLISYTDNLGLTLPMPSSESAGAAAYQFKVGDKYIISEIYLPDEYVELAKTELTAKANEYIQQYKAPQVSYSLSIDSAFLEKIAGGKLTVKNLFDLGDTLTVNDDDLGTSSGLRITAFERDLLQPYKYTFTLGEKVTATSITRIVKNLNAAVTAIKTNKLDDPTHLARNWRSTQEVLNAVFDDEGDYYTEKIKPLSIETKLLAVGARYQQFCLSGVTFYPNYGGDASVFKATAGTLTHYTLNDDGTARTWNLSAANVTELVDTALYYIYAKAPIEGTTGDIVLDTTAHSVTEGDYYYFLIGYLSSEIEGARQLTQSYGQTMINGRFVNTGRIQSADGKTFFDLDSGVISGNIKFVGSDGIEKSGADLYDKTTELNDYINNTIMPDIADLQSQIDGQIEQYFYTYNPTTANAPASGWTTDTEKLSHLGDIFYNTSTGKGWRWSKDGDTNTYSWQPLNDTDTAAALEAAQTALSEARERQRIFTAEPVPPYDLGDLYISADGDITKCTNARAEGVYVSTDWEPYTDLSTKTALETLESTTNTKLSEIQSQVDGKIETWYQVNDPANNWINFDDQLNHIGDIWINSTTNTIKTYRRKTNGVFTWMLVNDPSIAEDAWDTADAASEKVEKKTQTFIVTPYPPYNVGDLWLTGDSTNGELLRCVTARSEKESYHETDWTEATYYDNTQTEIDGGVVTAGSIQIVGTNSQAVVAGLTGADSADDNTDADDIRIWAGSDKRTRDKAPFRVNQSGELWATNANIEGSINTNEGSIAGFEIADGHIGKETDPATKTGDGLSLYADFIKFVSTYKMALMGTNKQISPLSNTNEAIASLINTTPNVYGHNIGLAVEVYGGMYNKAIEAKGDIVTEGDVIGYSFKQFNWSRTDYYSTTTGVIASQYDLTRFYKKVFINETSIYSNWTHNIALPTAGAVCDSLDIPDGTAFEIDGEITLYSSSGTYMYLRIISANKTLSYGTKATIILSDGTTTTKAEIKAVNIRYKLVYTGSLYLCYIL